MQCFRAFCFWHLPNLFNSSPLSGAKFGATRKTIPSVAPNSAETLAGQRLQILNRCPGGLSINFKKYKKSEAKNGNENEYPFLWEIVQNHE
jgi:hypothetical protein